MKIYIDESGNSGALKFIEGAESPILNIAAQPFFSLCGIGGVHQSEDLENLESKIDAIKSEYDIVGELKSSEISRLYPEFYPPFFKEIISSNFLIHVELVDKRYFLATALTESFIFKFDPIFPAWCKKEFHKRAYCLYSDKTLNYWLSFNIQPSLDTLELVYASLVCDLDSDTDILRILEMAFEDFEDDKNKFDSAYERYLYPPDKKGVIINPHTNAFSNLCAYFNFFDTNKLEIFHDEQSEMAKVLNETITDMISSTGAEADEFLQKSDFKFQLNEETSLSFGISDRSPLIQYADVLAGFFNYLYRDAMQGKSLRRDDVECYRQYMKRFSINFVTDKIII